MSTVHPACSPETPFENLTCWCEKFADQYKYSPFHSMIPDQEICDYYLG